MNVVRMIETYAVEMVRLEPRPRTVQELRNRANLNGSDIKWDGTLESQFLKGRQLQYRPGAMRTAMYRPFQKQQLYFDRQLNNSVYRLNELFPSVDRGTIGFYQVGAGSAVPFGVLALETIPDLHVTGAGSGGQFFARYSVHPGRREPACG